MKVNEEKSNRYLMKGLKMYCYFKKTAASVYILRGNTYELIHAISM